MTMLSNVIETYKKLNQNITQVIDLTGYKLEHVYTNMDMNRTTFYAKRKKANFTPDELSKILNIINFESEVLRNKNINNELSKILNV